MSDDQTQTAGPGENPGRRTYDQVLAQMAELEAIAAVAEAKRAELAAWVQKDMEADRARVSRTTDYGTLTLPVTRPGVVLADERALLEWVEANHPDEVEVTRSVRTAYIASLKKDMVPTPDGLLDPATGQLIPGWEWRAGGRPKTVSFRKDRDRFAALVAAVTARVDALMAGGELGPAAEQAAITARVADAVHAADPGVITVERAQQIRRDMEAEEQPPVRPAGPFVSTGTLTYIHTLLSKMLLTGRKEKLRYMSRLVGRELDTTRALTAAEAQHVVTALEDLVHGPPVEPWGTDSYPDDDPWGTPADEASPPLPPEFTDANPADDPWGSEQGSEQQPPA